MELTMTSVYQNMTPSRVVQVDYVQGFCLMQASQHASFSSAFTLLAFCVSSSRLAFHKGNNITFTDDVDNHCSGCVSPVTAVNSVAPSHPTWYVEKPAAWSYIPDKYWDWRTLVDDPMVRLTHKSPSLYIVTYIIFLSSEGLKCIVSLMI